jgi:hypothetical protein
MRHSCAGRNLLTDKALILKEIPAHTEMLILIREKLCQSTNTNAMLVMQA